MSNAEVICGAVSALIGFGISNVAMAAVDAANTAVFFSYLESSTALEANHPAEYAEISSVWCLNAENPAEEAEVADAV